MVGGEDWGGDWVRIYHVHITDISHIMTGLMVVFMYWLVDSMTYVVLLNIYYARCCCMFFSAGLLQYEMNDISGNNYIYQIEMESSGCEN